MPRFLSDIIHLLHVGVLHQLSPSPDSEPQHRRCSEVPVISIYVFSDELLLRIFCHYQPFLFDEYGADDEDTLEVTKWDSERWWYKLAHVCRKWRHLVLASASHMGLSIVCSYATPVAAILTHLPSLPLIIDYGDEDRRVTSDDEEGILIALRNHLQVRRIRIRMSSSGLQRLFVAMDAEFPILEHLYIKSLTDDDSGLSFPQTFKAPQLRHFRLRNIAYSPATFRSLSPNTPVQPAKQIGEYARRSSSQPRKFMKTCIHILDDDSLLCIFYLCRPVILEEDEVNDTKILQGGDWDRERWWYKIVQVCRRWRYLIFASASHLGLNLLCTYGTPVTDMLAHSPSLPLVIDYVDEDRDITTADKDGLVFALQHCNRVRRIRVLMPVSTLQGFTTAFDNEFPMLEFLYIEPTTKRRSGLTLHEAFKAPHLRHLILITYAFPIRSPSFTTVVGLVTLSIQHIHPSTNCCPEDILQQLTHFPRLETLGISFCSTFTQRDVETQLLHRPLITDVTLPNLRWLGFRGVSTYLETLLPRMATPLLEKLQVVFFDQPDFSIPCLLQFMGAAKNLKFGSARFRFANNYVFVYMYPHEGALMYTFHLGISCVSVEGQVVSATQIFHQLRTIFSGVEYLTLEFRRSSLFSEMDDEANSIYWGDLFRPFNNVKTLRLGDELVGPISHLLQGDDGESATELFPGLKVLEYPASYGAENLFDGFIDTRTTAGFPVTVVHS